MSNQQSNTDTIFALSSASGKAGVAVVRVSGPLAWESLLALTPDQAQPAPRKTKLMNLSSEDKNGDRIQIDEAMVIGFKGPKSFTGEDVVEYHCHGSPAILDEMMRFLGQAEGHRLAQHGEFTRRAFDNGKLDLTEAEAIADLIDAETKAQKEQALLQMGGALSSLYNGWAEELTKALAYIEAIIDFPDEDVPDSETAKAAPAIENLKKSIDDHLNDNRRGERLRNGLQVAVIGAPNAGKSSLINLLAERDVSIVSDMAGTTRDVIEVHLNLGGFPVILADTAGLRPADIGTQGHEGIESEGIKRAIKRAEEADLKILMFDGALQGLDQDTLNLVDEKSIIVINKSDLGGDNKLLLEALKTSQSGESQNDNSQKPQSNTTLTKNYVNQKRDTLIKDGIDQADNLAAPVLNMSTKTQEGLSDFLNIVTKQISKMMSVSRETPSLTRSRHRQHLEECLEFLTNALSQTQPELMAQDLRFAVNALGRITGRVDVEDLLDVIFKDFCIGK